MKIRSGGILEIIRGQKDLPPEEKKVSDPSFRAFSEILHQSCANMPVTFLITDGVTRELAHVILSHG